MKDLAEHILESKAAGEAATHDALYRALVEFDNWMPPLAESWGARSPFEPFIEELLPMHMQEGRRVRALCTCYDASEAYRKQFGPTAFSDYGGQDIFALEWKATDALWLDPGTPLELLIDAEDFPKLRALAGAVAVEHVWKRFAKGDEKPGDLASVVTYDGYHLAAVQYPDGVRVLHAPHDDGGMFIPIFTHGDSLALAMPEFRREFGDAVRTVQASGLELFPPLVNEQAKGLVFNYRGPSTPLAFNLGIVELLLDEIARIA